MAVQAQYPSNVLFLNRVESEMKAVDYSQPQAGGFLEQSAVPFFSAGAGGNTKKRGREVAVPPSQQHGGDMNLLSLQPQAPPPPPTTLISLAQLQNQNPPLVSTGLRLAFEDQTQTQPHNPLPSSCPISSSFLADDLAYKINQQRSEIDRFIHAQSEQLRRALAERQRNHYRALVYAAEEAAARRLREKEAELERAARRSAELEDRLYRLRAESMAWQSKALTDQATAASLHAQIQQAAAAAAAGTADGEANEIPADDAESAHVDPRRVEVSNACRACWARPMSVVLIPCRHLCLCADCDSTAQQCPVCRHPRARSVHVLFS